MKKRTLLMSALALAMATTTLSGAAHAQDFPPKKPVTLVVGFAAGGAADAAARLIAKKLSENIGQSVAARAATSPTSSWPMRRPMAACCCSARWVRSPLRRT